MHMDGGHGSFQSVAPRFSIGIAIAPEASEELCLFE